jgi:hypothetical protein
MIGLSKSLSAIGAIAGERRVGVLGLRAVVLPSSVGPEGGGQPHFRFAKDWDSPRSSLLPLRRAGTFPADAVFWSLVVATMPNVVYEVVMRTCVPQPVAQNQEIIRKEFKGGMGRGEAREKGGEDDE